MATKTMKEVLATAEVGLKGFIVKRVVTLPLWKWEDGKAKFYRVDGPIKIGKVLSAARAAKGAEAAKQMEPAKIMPVTNLETNTQCELIVGMILGETLEENYKGQSYVGKCFTSTQTKLEGKRYRQYTLTEIETEA